MSEEDKKLQKHLIDEMMKVSKTNPDVMFYMEALMKKYEELEQKVEQKDKEIDRLNNNLKELSDFAIKIYKKELDKTSDWWLQEELKTSFDDINLATNFRLEEALKEDNKDV